jgi:GNAT acetyltransferase-like protein
MTPPSILRTLDELDELSDSWGALSAQSGLPMHDFAWIRAAAATFAADRRLHFIVVGAPPNITAVAPLVRSRNDDRCFELLGVGELYEPMDFLYATPSALDVLTDSLARFIRGCLALNRLPAKSGVIAALGRSYRGRGFVICQAVRGCPWIPLHARWTQPEQQLNAGRRSDLRRARRTAEAMGRVTFDVVRPTPGELGPLLDEAFRVEAGSWKGRAGTALASDSVRAPFYRRYAAAACRTGNLLVCFLRIGGRAAAMQIAVTCGDRFWLLKIGFDDAFARCSPGSLLMRETVRYAALQGLQAYEFLGVDEPWTRMWTEHVHPYVSLRAYPASWHGLSGFATDVGRVARRTLVRALQRT